jgi:hypothetical protein
MTARVDASGDVGVCWLLIGEADHRRQLLCDPEKNAVIASRRRSNPSIDRRGSGKHGLLRRCAPRNDGKVSKFLSMHD